MVVWATATVALLLVGTLVPGVRHLIRLTSLNPGQWALAFGAAFAGTFWIEAGKVVRLFRSASYLRGTNP